MARALLVVLTGLAGACHRPASTPHIPSQTGKAYAPNPRVPASTPEEGGQTETTQLTIEGLGPLVQRALDRGELPGCVIALGDHATLRWLGAYGERTAGEPMTVDTRFDLASVTKAVATAAAVMALHERGQVGLDEPAANALEELKNTDKRGVTPAMLLLHTSGLPEVNPLRDYERGPAAACRAIASTPLLSAPGRAFRYSDLGFILLGELVARRSGQTLADFVDHTLWRPLGMRHTRFNPPASEVPYTAPTEERDERVIRGVVDDPRAYRLGGIAGHAGLFSTAVDLARFARMVLGEGQLDGVRVLAPETVRTWLAPRTFGRALGFDMSSRLALGKGSLMSARAVGHGGYTGTSLWIDPVRDLFVVFLSNRVHLGAASTIHPLARNVADLAARALDLQRMPQTGLQTGLDVLEAEGFARVRGPQIALLSHEAARDRRGLSALAVLTAQPGVHVRTILAPEHGLEGAREGPQRDGRYGAQGISVRSLFGAQRRPGPEMLADVDLIVIDLVDVGTRFYTYMSTALATLEAAAAARLPVVVLDRPNPLGGLVVEGPVSQASYASFVNYHPLPLRHGMTAGELLRWLARERGIPVTLEVVRMRGYARTMMFSDTGLRFHPPSPNLTRAEQTLLYPALALVEGTNVSVGRGTKQAFEVLGAPFLDAESLRDRLVAEGLQGVDILTTRFTPRVGPHAHRRIPGVLFRVTDARAFRAAPLGLAIIRALQQVARANWDRTRLAPMLAHGPTLRALASGEPLSAVMADWEADLSRFRASRERALLY